MIYRNTPKKRKSAAILLNLRKKEKITRLLSLIRFEDDSSFASTNIPDRSVIPI